MCSIVRNAFRSNSQVLPSITRMLTCRDPAFGDIFHRSMLSDRYEWQDDAARILGTAMDVMLTFVAFVVWSWGREGFVLCNTRE